MKALRPCSLVPYASSFLASAPLLALLALFGCSMTPGNHSAPLTPEPAADHSALYYRAVARAAASIPLSDEAESPLADQLADLLRETAGADVALLDPTTLAGPLAPSRVDGSVTYADIFATMPYAGRAVVLRDVPASTVFQALEHSAQFCAGRGSLALSGVRVVAERNCLHRGFDPMAKILRIESRALLAGKVDVVLTEALHLSGFRDARVERDLGELRDLVLERLMRSSFTFFPTIDGRWEFHSHD